MKLSSRSRRLPLFLIGLLSTSLHGGAQVDARLYRFPDVSQTQIVFSYANDLWLVSKAGGQASKISSPPGVESYPKFSPDGQTLAFSGNYDGNRDVYTISVNGGVPERLTEHGYPDRVVDWTPDGANILFASARESGKQRFNQFYTIPRLGGSPTKLPLAYAEFGSYSPDGKRMALVFRTQVGRNWKRYRGGWKADIHLFDFTSDSSRSITREDDAGAEFPMWSGGDIYFLSDRGKELRMNLWRYNLASQAIEQVTHFTEYDIHYPSLGPQEIVFEASGKLWLYSLSDQSLTEVKVTVKTDEATLRPHLVTPDKIIQSASLSPDGSRALLAARGEIFSLPAENGFIKDLTQTSGIAERYPAWSPDGRKIAFWSDRSGEYELYVSAPDETATATPITKLGPGYRYRPFWSPDGKKIAFIDKAMRLTVIDIATRTVYPAGKALRYDHGNLENFTCSWSSDSRWLAFCLDLENSHAGVFLYDHETHASKQITSGFYDIASPVFDPGGKYLYVITSQSFVPTYSDIDNSFIYGNAGQLGAIALQTGTPSLLYPKNDTVSLEIATGSTPGSDSKKRSAKTAPATADAATKSAPVSIDMDGLESRLVLLPLSPGHYQSLSAAKDRIYYLKLPATGSTESQASLKYYDLEKREEKSVVAGIDGYELSLNAQKILLQKDRSWTIVHAEDNQKFEKPLRTIDMKMMVDPAAEWRQIFQEAWRLERDYFYDSAMHGVDWAAVRKRYEKMLQGAVTREDLDFILGEMLGELNASHTYHGGGDLEMERNTGVGYLGVNYEAAGKFYRIKSILRAAPWDAEVRSSLAQPGVRIKEGDYLLAVNGVPLTTDREPFSAFQDLADKAVELTYNTNPSWEGARSEVVQTMKDEYRLRHLSWIESNRKTVSDATSGTVGYIFVPSTGLDGQNELIRQFNGQWDKAGLIIDERFNDGGQIPDRFIEMLNRTPLSFVATRDGEDWPWPPFAHFGPKVMLINGWAGSGGDAFPDFFRRKKLGPLIGARTWGGLIGISGSPELIDGGRITVPSFRIFDPSGVWFKEGHGVDPDIAVPEDLGAMARGEDPQLLRGIQQIREMIQKNGFVPPKTPAREDR